MTQNKDVVLGVRIIKISVIEQIEIVQVGASLRTYAMISLTAGGMT